MTNNLDTLLTALYIDLEDRILPSLGFSRDHRRGRTPVLTDAELICLAVAQHLLGHCQATALHPLCPRSLVRDVPGATGPVRIR